MMWLAKLLADPSPPRHVTVSHPGLSRKPTKVTADAAHDPRGVAAAAALACETHAADNDTAARFG